MAIPSTIQAIVLDSDGARRETAATVHGSYARIPEFRGIVFLSRERVFGANPPVPVDIQQLRTMPTPAPYLGMGPTRILVSRQSPVPLTWNQSQDRRDAQREAVVFKQDRRNMAVETGAEARLSEETKAWSFRMGVLALTSATVLFAFGVTAYLLQRTGVADAATGLLRGLAA